MGAKPPSVQRSASPERSETAPLLGRRKSASSAQSPPQSPKSTDSTAASPPESGTESQDTLDDDLRDIPATVREIVAMDDDPSIPVVTFRVFLLAFVFIIPGAFIDTINAFRTTAAAYLIFFVQIASHAAGEALANRLPRRDVNCYFFKFNLNPGPWLVKETALVTVAAKSGATGNLATNALALVELYFGVRVPAPAAMLFMWAIVFMGYSYAAIAKNLVSFDPQFQWPQLLMQTALLQSQKRYSSERKSGSAPRGRSQMSVFFIAAGGLCVWQLFPEFFFPMTSSIAVLCYMAPHNPTINFIGSGLGGMGFLNISLDWANITSLVLLYPYWIQVLQFVGFAIGAWVLLPLAKFSLLFPFKYGLMSNGLFQANGHPYPTEKLITNSGGFNQTAYEHYGPVHLGSQRAWNMFFDYAAYVSGIVWVVAFAWDKLKACWRRGLRKFDDRLNKLHAAYDEVPFSWYAALFCVSLSSLVYVHVLGYLFMPWWTCLIALCIGSVIVTPLMWLYALSNFQLPIGTFNELIYGYIIQGQGLKDPGGASFFGSLAGNAWYRAQFHLEAMKLGFFNHLPPKTVFFAQIFGELIGVPINYYSFRWVMVTKGDYLSGKKKDPIHQWTGQAVMSYHTNAIQYVVLGPKRLFKNYPLLPYGFLVGLICPLAVFVLHKRFPRSKLKFDLWNTTVLFLTLSHFYGNISTGFISKFLVGTGAMFYAYRYKHGLWKKYNYVLAAALDTGFNLAMTILFIMFAYGLRAPHWFGNDERNVERCFALDE